MKKYILLLFAMVLGVTQLHAQADENAGAEIFMKHLRNNWDDIHDVIMRYHYEDPWLQGRVLIEMSWAKGKLEHSEIMENTSGNDRYANDLVKALQQWEISALSDAWSSALPVKTSIKGSDDPDFSEYGILTGKLTDQDGNPIPEAGLVLIPIDRTSNKSIAMHTNREGIFIETLIPPGKWQISCNIDGYVPVVLDDILLEAGKHWKQDITVKANYREQGPARPTESEIKDAARKIMASVESCALITIDREGRPRARAMDAFLPEGDFTVWFGTNARSRKVEQIKNNPKTTLYYLEAESAGYVLIYGNAEIVDDQMEKEKRWKAEWEAFYPDGRENYLLIKFSPEWMEVVSYTYGIHGDPESWEPAKIIFDSE